MITPVVSPAYPARYLQQIIKMMPTSSKTSPMIKNTLSTITFYLPYAASLFLGNLVIFENFKSILKARHPNLVTTSLMLAPSCPNQIFPQLQALPILHLPIHLLSMKILCNHYVHAMLVRNSATVTIKNLFFVFMEHPIMIVSHELSGIPRLVS